MAAIAKALARVLLETNENSDSVFPVLMFSVIGLMLTIDLVLAFRMPLFIGFETF